MKKYIIRVSGRAYEVEVEEVKAETPGTEAAQAAPKAAFAAPAPTPPATPSPVAPGGGPSGRMTAPMTGTVVKIKAAAGDAVAQGDVLMTLEAMKMENEIFAPAAGVVRAVHVSVGDSVNAGDALMDLE